MEGIGDVGMDAARGDLMKKLDDDTAIHVLQYLDTTRDIACASGVCRSWRRFVLEGQLWKGLCLKEFPEVKTFEEVAEIDLTRDAQAAGSSGSSFRQNLEREERIYRHLLRELRHEPAIEKSCIRDAVVASSTDNYPEESIVQTLYPRPRYSDDITPSYWSSTGQRDVNCPETLTYNLMSNLCVVHEVRIRPFQAFFQIGHPIYSAKYIRIRLGYAIEKPTTDCESPKKEYVWSYESPKFIMEQADSMQVFKLPRPVLCIGGVLQVELLGRVQTQELDQLYYICICHVSVVGWPVSDFRARLSGDQRKFFLDYIGQFQANEAGGDAANKLLVPEGETPAGTWMSFAERIRQLRATRVLRPNRLFLNTLLGNITVASLLLAQEDQEDSSDDEVDMEDVDGDGDEEEEDSHL
ncbi:hypothetical protein M758_6G086500 [Ceratodon purpureus]|uniref:F-box domain-containing protein n=1 Tax=Ceratodon purpureus TaxID=3225 RepID=A0A8T0HC75_CERPU|nr:hypothetical protein KC19_6G090500 [Ceratodon purpureus]KAG0613221.1 hypothetical protein M758_6G086500 [Ceratodon purpureus]